MLVCHSERSEESLLVLRTCPSARPHGRSKDPVTAPPFRNAPRHSDHNISVLINARCAPQAGGISRSSPSSRQRSLAERFGDDLPFIFVHQIARPVGADLLYEDAIAFEDSDHFP